MPVAVNEFPDSRKLQGNPPSGELRYKVTGTTDETLAVSYATSASPATWFTPFGALYRQDIKIDPDGWNQWFATVPYAALTQNYGSFSFAFDTSGGTARIKAAKSHVASYNASGATGVDHYKSLIGYNRKTQEAEGCDIVIPALRLSYTIRQPAGLVTETYAKQVARLTGYTNLNPFRSFAQGELLFAGATGQDGSQTEAEVSYHFIASQNETITIGDIANVVKAGHAYAWVEFTDNLVGGELTAKPLRVHVERVYDQRDFATYLLWS